MKRTFKSYDESRTGLLNVADFRQVSCVEQLTVRKLQYFNVSFLIEHFLENGAELWYIKSSWLPSVNLPLTISRGNLSPHTIIHSSG